MCFSASASFVAAASLSGVGVASIRRTRTRRELAFAAIPLLFGIQQATEGVLWISIGAGEAVLAHGMTYLYSFFSHTLWPVYVPVAVALLEPVRWRRRVLGGFELLGFVVGGYLLYAIVRDPVTAQVVERHIAYLSPHFYVAAVLVTYFTATCLSMGLSSHRLVNLFGIFSLSSALATYHFAASAFVSVWCFFAAVLSLLVLLQITPQALHDGSARRTHTP